MKPKLLVSACLLGENCKYSGGNNYNPAIEALREYYDLVAVCPEQLGGLPPPRTPSERVGGKVLTRDGRDVTEAFFAGAAETLAIAQSAGVSLALFQPRSPSCGCGQIYDGTFSGKLIPGKGVTTELLEQNGIKIYTDTQIDELVSRKGER